MAKYTNFFETIQEANMRLRNTFILYDGEVHYVLACSNHKNDGIFRIYLQKTTGSEMDMPWYARPSGYPGSEYESSDPELGIQLDNWMNHNEGKHKVIRKKMNSPLFKNFRPYPLGMYNSKDGRTLYLERLPNRRTEQGLTSSMLVSVSISELLSSLSSARKSLDKGYSLWGEEFQNCAKGVYPAAEECVQKLLDPNIANTAIGFSRDFAFVRGPIDILFLCYKSEIVGYLPDQSLNMLKLSKDCPHLFEQICELGVFNNIAKG